MFRIRVFVSRGFEHVDTERERRSPCPSDVHLTQDREDRPVLLWGGDEGSRRRIQNFLKSVLSTMLSISTGRRVVS